MSGQSIVGSNRRTRRRKSGYKCVLPIQLSGFDHLTLAQLQGQPARIRMAIASLEKQTYTGWKHEAQIELLESLRETLDVFEEIIPGINGELGIITEAS